jgi:hypothetical protein
MSSRADLRPGGEDGRTDVRAACALIASLKDSEALSESEMQTLLAAAVRLYADRAAKRETAPDAFAADSGVTATDAMVATSAILKAVNLQLFELGMWQAWSGR